MSDVTNEKQDDENITVSKIYETLKSGPFLKKLYWDVLSDIKEKETFKEIKKTTEKLLNKKTDVLANLTDSESDNIQRKTIVAEICSMTYAMDTVFSKILFIKLEKEFKSHITDALKELRQERKIPDSVWAKLQIFDDPQATSTSESSSSKKVFKSPVKSQKAETSSRPVRMRRKRLTSTELATKNREIRSEIHEDLKAINSEDGKGAASSKNSKAGNKAGRKQTSGSVKNIAKKKQAEENHIPSKSNTISKNTEDKVILKEEFHIENQESDAESEISVGHMSLTSVSSVHTSDLSSFDDAISLSSEDGDGDDSTKKKLSLKEWEEMCSNGNFSNKFNGSMFKNAQKKQNSKIVPANDVRNEKQIEQNSKIVPANDVHNEKQTESSPGNIDTTPDSGESSTEVRSPSQKTLPKRIRRPNSRYSSENIVCNIVKVRERKMAGKDGGKQQREQPEEVRNEVKNSPDATQLSKKRTSNTQESDGETPHKIVKTVTVKEEIDTESYLEKEPKQCNSSEFYQPHSAVRSLTTRKTAPVTLFST